MMRIVCCLSGLLIAAAPSVALAGDEAPAALPQSMADLLWLVLAGVLVFFMQAGFAMLESGLTRSKNAVNVISKNLIDFSFGAIVFWAIGYSFMYGTKGSAFIGWDPAYVFMSGSDGGTDASTSAGWFFQMVFAATAATIVSGAVAERTKLFTYVVMSILLTGLLYPITGHWIWGEGGWLNSAGMRDFAGSTVVHSVGAWAALASAYIVGPRIGKYGQDGSVNTIPGHNLPMAALGTFILWFGWYGFNAGSTLAMIDGIPHVVVTTTLGAAGGAVVSLIMSWSLHPKKPNLGTALNGALGGLVGITAGCASVSASSALIIGGVAGLVVVAGVELIDRVLKIDDPVGAVSVHGLAGAWGTIAIGLFGQRAVDIRYWDEATAISDGLFFGGGAAQLGVQVMGVVSVMAFTLVTSFVLMFILHKTVGLRVSREMEISGLDITEHGHPAYCAGDEYPAESEKVTPPAVAELSPSK
ncbi:MAG: ammonium transporter [Myxococcota bacterium]